MTLRHIISAPNQIAFKSAYLQEVRDASGQWWLMYSIGADLAPKLDLYRSKGFTLGDPEPTGNYMGATQGEGVWDMQTGVAIHKRPIVPLNKGPGHDQALADADGENDYPRHADNVPVSYIRETDHHVWLVYQRGPHLIQVLDELWDKGKAVHGEEIQCTIPDEMTPPSRWEILTHKGLPVYRRLVVPKDHPQAVNPHTVPNRTPRLLQQKPLPQSG